MVRLDGECRESLSSGLLTSRYLIDRKSWLFSASLRTSYPELVSFT